MCHINFTGQVWVEKFKNAKYDICHRQKQGDKNDRTFEK